jgi:hypothetical protein
MVVLSMVPHERRAVDITATFEALRGYAVLSRARKDFLTAIFVI